MTTGDAGLSFGRLIMAYRTLEAERDALKAENERLGNELEQERVRMAGISVAASGWAKGDHHCEEGAYGWSPAFDEVKKLRAQVDNVEAAMAFYEQGDSVAERDVLRAQLDEAVELLRFATLGPMHKDSVRDSWRQRRAAFFLADSGTTPGSEPDMSGYPAKRFIVAMTDEGNFEREAAERYAASMNKGTNSSPAGVFELVPAEHMDAVRALIVSLRNAKATNQIGLPSAIGEMVSLVHQWMQMNGEPT